MVANTNASPDLLSSESVMAHAATLRVASLIGAEFGRWTVVEADLAHHRKGRSWICRCACGVTRSLGTSQLTLGVTTSCGCRRPELLRAAATRHGHNSGSAPSSTYESWRAMLWRCRNPAETYHGAMGVAVCDRWQSFLGFLADMRERPPGTTLDRFPDPDGNYEPGNCRWATSTEQNRNRRSTSTCALGVVLIRQMRLRGAMQKDIAYAFGLSRSGISLISRGIQWANPLADIGGAS